MSDTVYLLPLSGAEIGLSRLDVRLPEAINHNQHLSSSQSVSSAAEKCPPHSEPPSDTEHKTAAVVSSGGLGAANQTAAAHVSERGLIPARPDI